MEWYPPPPNEAGREFGRETDAERVERSEKDRLIEGLARPSWWRRLWGPRSARARTRGR